MPCCHFHVQPGGQGMDAFKRGHLPGLEKFLLRFGKDIGNRENE